MSFRAYFVVRGTPQTKGSTRAFKRGPKIVTTNDNPKAAGWQQLISLEAQRHAPAAPVTGPVSVVLRFEMQRPASVSERKRPLPITKPDVDKIARLAIDALTGVIIADDKQVTDLMVTKRYGVPGVTITVQEASLQPQYQWRECLPMEATK